MVKSIDYGGQHVSVSDEVADFLESDNRRQAAQDRSDGRHLSKSDFEKTALPQRLLNPHALEDHALRHLRLQDLHMVMNTLSDDESRLIQLYFYEELSMEKVGEQFGISKMAISKRLKKLYAKMRDLLK